MTDGNLRPDDSVDEYLGLLRADLATPEVLTELYALLAQNRNARREYVRAMHFQASLHWLLEGQVPGAEAVRAEVRRQLATRRRRIFWIGSLTLIACQVLAGFGLIFGYQRSVSDVFVAPVVAQVGLMQSPQWGDGRSRSVGQVLRSGTTFQLLSGVAGLRMTSGAEVVVQSPASWQFDSPQRMILLEGRLTAEVPPQAVGFTVEAGAARLIDLGTRFGVSVDRGQSPEFHVFQGRVEAGSAQLPYQLLEQHQAARFSTDGRQQQLMSATPDAFVSCLQFAAGVAELSGQVRFFPRPLSELSSLEIATPGIMHVFQERQQFILEEDLSVVSVAESELNTSSVPPISSLPAGTKVDDYFVQFRAQGGGRVGATMRFQRPIVGLILQPHELDKTDAILGFSAIRYVPPDAIHRGAVITPGDKPRVSDAKTLTDDRLILSPDRRTVTLQLNVNPSDLDQLRILVAADGPVVPEVPAP